jgi:hypothetical protein
MNITYIIALTKYCDANFIKFSQARVEEQLFVLINVDFNLFLVKFEQLAHPNGFS